MKTAEKMRIGKVEIAGCLLSCPERCVGFTVEKPGAPTEGALFYLSKGIQIDA
jgi:hypothetical protein